MRQRLLPALILIIIGVLFLGTNLGFFKSSIGMLFATWWPLIPLISGVCILFWGSKR